MNAEIIAVGTELLLGDIVNGNAQYISKQLAALGIGMFYQTVVGDNSERLLAAYDAAFARADLVITTGGLGPTNDDITKEVAAKYFGLPLVLDEQSYNNIIAFFEKQTLKLTENNKKQAFLPEGAKALPNAVGTAPGILLEHNGKTLIMLPGPPIEMNTIFEAHVLPYLKEKTDRVFVSRTLRLCGIGESMAESLLRPILDKQTNPTIAPYAKTGEVHFRITASAPTEAEARQMIEPMAIDVYALVGEHIYGEDDVTLEAAVVRLLKEQGLTVAFAESCTGGMLTARLVNAPGASAVLTEGIVTYSNESKIKRLGVKPETITAHGAVSRETAEEMAIGAARTSGANLAVAVTGVAGPDGGTDDKPVGLVYIAICLNGSVTTKTLRLSGPRERIRLRTVTTALDLLRRQLTA